ATQALCHLSLHDALPIWIVRLMRDAQGSRAPIQRLADRISAVFVPIVISIAIATFVVWFIAAGEAPLVRAVAAAVTVLIIACPRSEEHTSELQSRENLVC